jgi:dTDP-4-dehydrorhamnose reductase
VRTAWVYGATGSNFVKTMARLEAQRDTVSVVDDQTGSPTWSRDLARGLWALAREDAPAGTYHCTNRGETTWHGFTQAIFEELGADPARVLPTDSASFARPAPRPAYSVLSPRAWEAAGLPQMPQWRSALSEAFRLHGSAFRPAAPPPGGVQ